MVISFARRNKTGMHYWLCRCDCGIEREVLSAQLRTGGSKSCGCLQKFRMAPKSKKHGMWKHPAYRVWIEMRSRCQNSGNAGYHLYGGRGITVCERWEDFALFWEDMGPTWQRGLSLERIDNDGDYGPHNCRWATPFEQNRNMRSNRYIQTPWGRMTAKDAALKSGIPSGTVYQRMWAGCPEDRLLVPPRKRR
jgi:hypothetical protein